MKWVYSIPCSCGIPYIGEIGRSINLIIQEHATDSKQKHSHPSAIVEHAEKTKHHLCIEDSKVTGMIDHFHHGKLREAIEIGKQVKNLNRDDGWKLSKNWILALSL